MDPTRLYSMVEVSAHLGITPRTLQNYLRDGRIVAQKIGGRWMFTRDEVERFKTGGKPKNVLGAFIPGLMVEIDDLRSMALRAIMQGEEAGGDSQQLRAIERKIMEIRLKYLEPMQMLSK